ncbi:MAG: HD domain-containing protein [Armatimonadetes bacterium]|nr:HD domain-containing protein [Armatimonadota bacterium]
MEIPLIDTPEFQRLRGIKQLGTASLVYPSAVHTRFEHSLGTCWLARRMVDDLGGFSEEQRRAIFAAALLHDVSHIPFGHTFEDERHIFERHDVPERQRAFLRRGALGKALERLGLLGPVSDILCGDGPPAARDIVSGTICADLLDYLARDSYFCGLRGGYDERLFRYFRMDAQGLYLEAQKAGIIRADAVSEVVNLLRQRYFLSERVYYHHAKTASGAMISRAVECAVNQGLLLDTLNGLTDDRLLMLLEEKYGKDPVIGRLLAHFASHRLYKRAYVLTRRAGEERLKDLVATYHYNRAAREEAEQALTRRLKLKEGELIVYCPSDRMALKEARVRVRVDSGPPRSLDALNVPEIDVLLDKHRDLWRFYVFLAPGHEDRMRKVGAACEAWFQAPNHLPALQSGQLFLGGMLG